MTNNMQHIFRSLRKSENYITHGVYYGFPKCCIINFCIRSEDSCIACNKSMPDYNTPDKNKGGYCRTCKTDDMIYFGIERNNTGFLPCYSCCNKIGFDKKKIPSLILNRIDKSVFPETTRINLDKKDSHDIFMLEIAQHRKADDREPEYEYDSDDMPELIEYTIDTLLW